MTHTMLGCRLVLFLATVAFAYRQRALTEDTSVQETKGRFVLTYTLDLSSAPTTTWYLKHDVHYQKIDTSTDKYNELIRRVNRSGIIQYHVFLDIYHINADDFGEYKVEVNNDDQRTRTFPINEMPSDELQQTSVPANSGGDKIELSRNQVYVASAVGSGILIVLIIIVVAVVVRSNYKGRPNQKRDAESEVISGDNISSHHYTDIHSESRYDGLDGKRDNHTYTIANNSMAGTGAYMEPTSHLPTTPKKEFGKPKQSRGGFANTMYGEQDNIKKAKTALKPPGLLKPTVVYAYSKKQNKVRRFSDSTSDREESSAGAYENVKKYKDPTDQSSAGIPDYVNVNTVKRSKSAQ